MTPRQTRVIGFVAFAAFVAFVAVLPSFISDFKAQQYAYVGIYLIALLGLNILTGYTGQISLGHGAFMNESISRSAGAEFGQELPPEAMEELIRSGGRFPRQRTTLYGEPPEERVRASFGAEPLAEPLNPPVKDAGLVAPPRLVRPGLLAAGAARS